jgi:Na+/glutamate symporter
MESSVMAEGYMGLGATPEALAQMLRLQAVCRHFRGEFTCLWHNDHFTRIEERAMYQRLLDTAAEPSP